MTFLFATNQAVSYEYTEKIDDVGSFTLILPLDKTLLSDLAINQFITNDDGDWLWIQAIHYDDNKITLSGKDCKGLLELRVSLFGAEQETGTQGYDVVSGTTSQCVQHYLDNNIINPADNSRKIPMNFLSQTDGLAEDSYMARLEKLSDIIKNLCQNAGIGYSIIWNFTTNQFLFVLKSGTDRSMNQSEISRVIFCPSWGNVISQEFEHDISNYYNIAYSEGAGIVQTVQRGSIEPSGIQRRECTTSVSVETTKDIEKYTLYALEDNTETHSFQLKVSAQGYGTEYFLGDTVTVRDSYTHSNYNAVITQVTKKYSATEQNIEITLGKKKLPLLNRIIKNMTNGILKR